MMNLEAEKLSLIQWLAQVTDEEIIDKIKTLRASTSDWWDQITIEERTEIEEGLSQANSGEVIPHEEVMKKYRKWP